MWTLNIPISFSSLHEIIISSLYVGYCQLVVRHSGLYSSSQESIVCLRSKAIESSLCCLNRRYLYNCARVHVNIFMAVFHSKAFDVRQCFILEWSRLFHSNALVIFSPSHSALLILSTSVNDESINVKSFDIVHKFKFIRDENDEYVFFCSGYRFVADFIAYLPMSFWVVTFQTKHGTVAPGVEITLHPLLLKWINFNLSMDE